MEKQIKTILVLLAFLALSAFFHFYFKKEGDGDIFYHFKHAEIYAERGITYSEFPWLPHTIIGRNNADQWYGFHLLLIPFTYFADSPDDASGRIFGIKLAGVFITTMLLLLFYLSLKIMKSGKEFFWTIFMFFSAPPVMAHLLLIRPHALSTGLGALLFAMLVSGYGYLAIFAISFLLTWFHPNLFWLPLLIGGVVLLTEFYREKTILWRKFITVFAGVIAGLVITPNPIGTLRTIFIEVFGSPLASLSGVRLNSGTELMPLSYKDLWVFSLFILIWLSAFLMSHKTEKRLNLSIFSCSALSAIFLIMTLFIVKRSMDLWVVYGSIFAAGILKPYIDAHFQGKRKAIALNSILICAAVLMISFETYMYSVKMKNTLWNIKEYEGAAKWLSASSVEGDLVLNASWDYFQYLFFWNHKNYYTSGTDPYLLYTYDKELFRKSEALRLGIALDMKNYLQSFGAKYIFVTQNEPELMEKLLHDDNFEAGYKDGRVAVFKIKAK